MNKSSDEFMQNTAGGNINSSVLQPKFIFNDYNSGFNLLTELQKELISCEEFYFSVAFITQSGLICLKEVLAHLNKKNIKGCILTTDYLCFTEPKALRELQQFANLEIRIYTQGNFHTKGYIFRHADYYSLIIGSSNLTQGALKANKEWNLKVSSTEQEAFCRDTLQEL